MEGAEDGCSSSKHSETLRGRHRLRIAGFVEANRNISELRRRIRSRRDTTAGFGFVTHGTC